MKKSLLLIVFAFCIIATGCKSTANVTENTTKPDVSLRNTRWVLQTINGKPIQPSEDARETHILFEYQGNRFRGFAGCNNMSGEFTLEPGNKIRLGKAIATKMYCNNNHVESEFLKILDNIDSYAIKGESLSLMTKGKVIATFKAVYL